jgi:non-heme chloroperoxidase
MRKSLLVIAAVGFFTSCAQAQDARDTSSHQVRFVEVDKDVKLEVLDWGGSGRPLVFLAGLGNTAHVYDPLAPKFTANHHVYGITRRGWGASSKPEAIVANYAADRLGDDVLAVIDALKLDRPVLAGHSIAGEELSSIGSRHPEKVAGLIYLDAADAYGYYDQARGDPMLDMIDLRDRINVLEAGALWDEKFSQGVLASAEMLEKDMQEMLKRMALMPRGVPPPPPPPPIGLATRFGEKKYTEIHAPVLAIFACPHNFDPMFRGADKSNEAAMVANDRANCSAQADAFARGVPSARVVRIADADHYVFRSNEAEVVREMNTFLATVP